MANSLLVEHGRHPVRPSFRVLATPVMCDRESFLVSLQMDLRSQPAGMTEKGVMPEVLYRAFCWAPVTPDIRDREPILLTKT